MKMKIKINQCLVLKPKIQYLLQEVQQEEIGEVNQKLKLIQRGKRK